jgi:putative DNA primase/helicase
MTTIKKQIKEVNINRDFYLEVAKNLSSINQSSRFTDVFNEDDYIFEEDTAKHCNFDIKVFVKSFEFDGEAEAEWENSIHVQSNNVFYYYSTELAISEYGWTPELQTDYNIENNIQAPETEEEKTSIEYKYGLEVQKDERIRILPTEKDSKVFQWVGNHWSLMTEQQGRTKAIDWLTGGFKQFATSKMASSCHETLKLKANKMPAETKETIIPLQNVWLKVGANNEFKIVPPNKETNITYVISTRLNVKPGQTVYTPSKVPASSKFYKYLTSVLPKTQILDLVQEYCGYTLLNDNRFQKAMVMEGDGANGKSVLIEIIRQLHQNARSIRLNQLESFGLTPLLDASLVISAETPKKKISEDELKSAISGDLMTIEGKGKDLISHKPKAKWIISCNTFPHIDDKTNGVLRRLIIVPFQQTFDEKDQIKNLEQILIDEELEIILNWCLEGLQRLLKRNNFQIPEEISNLKKRKQEESDPVRRFANEFGIVVDTHNFTMTKQEIYDDYRTYSDNEGVLSCGQEEFWKRMKRVFPTMQETRKVLPGKGKTPHRMVDLKMGEYEPSDPSTSSTASTTMTPELEALFRQWQAQEQAKGKPQLSAITERTPEGEALYQAHLAGEVKAKEEIRIQTLIKKQEEIIHKPEPKESQTWTLDGIEYKFKPSYLKALSEKNKVNQ